MDFEESLVLPSAILASVAQTSDRWAQRADRDRRRRKRTFPSIRRPGAGDALGGLGETRIAASVRLGLKAGFLPGCCP